MTAPLRVLLADDHVPIRAGVRIALEEAGLEVCGEAANANAAIEQALRERPDVCVLDIHMPGDGIRAAAAIKDALPETAVVMLTVSRNDPDLFEAIKAGASGYLLKDADPEGLPHALERAAAGEAVFPGTLVARLVDEFREVERRHRPSLRRRSSSDLTSREWEVLECLREGLTTAEIATRLFLSQTTVRRHVGSILKKLDVPDRSSAIRALDGRSRNLNAE